MEFQVLKKGGLHWLNSAFLAVEREVRYEYFSSNL